MTSNSIVWILSITRILHRWYMRGIPSLVSSITFWIFSIMFSYTGDICGAQCQGHLRIVFLPWKTRHRLLKVCFKLWKCLDVVGWSIPLRIIKVCFNHSKCPDVLDYPAQSMFLSLKMSWCGRLSCSKYVLITQKNGLMW